MSTITIQKNIEISGSYDAVICGGGPAGFITAIAAARSGAKTALIERYGFLGGMPTAGLVAPISEFMHNGELVIGGIPWEFIKKLEADNGALIEMPTGNVSYDPEKYKLRAQRMLLEAGVDLYLHSYISGCEVQGDTITHIVFETKDGTKALEARYVADCTGDGDIAFLAGVPLQTRSAELQPATLYFCLGNVDTDNVDKIHHEMQNVNYHMEPFQEKLREIAKKENVPNFGGPWMSWMMHKGMVLVNMTRMQANMVNPYDQTAAECKLREDVHRFVEILKTHFDQFKDTILISTATQVGIRETRRIRGMHILTSEEYRRAYHFHDAIGRGAHPIDIHASGNNEQKCEFLAKAAYIPYRSLITDSFSNYIAAGRCFSADREASASARVQGSVMSMGQAAGEAIAICSTQKISLQEIDIEVLRSRLIRIGANI